MAILGLDSPQKASIFAGYVSLFVAQGVLVKLSQRDGAGYAYDVSVLVLMTEFTKLVMNAYVYGQHEECVQRSRLAFAYRSLCLFCVSTFDSPLTASVSQLCNACAALLTA
jgi:hypothetical protein